MITRTPTRRFYILIPALLVVTTQMPIEKTSAADPLNGFTASQQSGTANTSQPTRKSGFSIPFGRSKPHTVRLSFYNTSWEKVIRKIAKETGSTLNMQDVPPGRYSRRDFNRYSRTDALRILNEALEPKGFRLLENGKILTVLNMRALRTKYPRPVIPNASSVSSQREIQNEIPQQSRFNQSRYQPLQRNVRGNRNVASQSNSWNGTNSQWNSISRSQGGRYPSIRQTALTTEQPLAGQQQNTVTVVDQSRSTRSVLTTVKTHKPAADIARMIYRELRNRSELMDIGPAGLPAFRVFRDSSSQVHRSAADLRSSFSPQSANTELFAIGIDTARSELVISSTLTWARETEKLIRALDAVPTTPYGIVQLVGHTGDVRRIAQVLQPQLNRLVAQRDPGQQSQPQNEKLQPSGQSKEEILLDIRGPVKIEYVPGIGLIIEGNEADVEKVRKIIDLIDKAAAGTVPEIRIHQLRNVNSQSMADLLNNMYSQLATLRGDAQAQATVNIIPVVNPNAILILAPKASLDSIVDTVQQLDQPVDPRANLQVFRLKYAIASQVAAHLESLFPQPQANQPGLFPRVTAVADSRTNSVIVQAQPRDMTAVAATIRKLDKLGPKSVNRMKIYPLKSAVAEELAEIINTTLQSVINPARPSGQAGGQFGGQAGGQVNQELLEAKSVMLEFLSSDERGQRIVRSGVLADIRVTADPRRNVLVVTAPEESMALMDELIAELDKPTSLAADIKIIPLKNSDASAMVDLLEGLFAPDQQGQAEVTFASADDASSGLIPVRFEVDVRTNTVIAIGGAGALQVVEAILLTLDESDMRQRKTKIVRLKNSFSDDIADALNRFLTAQRDLAQLDPELISNVELLEKEIIVESEPVTNSLIISATPRYYDEILEMVATLDEAPAQVIIQALLVEVELDNADEFGVELGFQDSMLFNRGLLNQDNFQTILNTFSDPSTGIQTTTETIINQENIPGFNFANAGLPLGNNTAINPSSIGTQGLSNFSLGRVNGDLGFGGLVLSAQSESVSVLIRALASRRNVHILSRPQIRTLDNVEATIVVGQDFPVITDFLPGTATTSPTPLFTRENAGIQLTVIPRVSPDGMISLTVIAEKSSFTGESVPLIADVTTGNVIESPIKDIINVATTVSVPDGQTIVIGGMITKTDDTLERKVPWLGDIPLLGNAFRYDSTSTRRTELLIFLTPRIIRNDADSEFIKQVEWERMHAKRETAEEIHGPIFAIPAESSGDDIAPMAPEQNDSLPMMRLDSDNNIPTTIMSGHSTSPQFRQQLPAETRIGDRRSSSNIRRSTQQPSSQTPRKRAPLLKRLFSPRSN